MIDFETQQKVLHEPFDIETHKQTFRHYLEVMIDTDGIVYYAVPSHQEWLAQKYMRLHNCSRDEMLDDVPADYYSNVVLWLCKETGCVAVWNESIIGDPNAYQIETLIKLKESGLYGGDLRADS